MTEEWVESAIPFDSVRQDDPNAEVGTEALLVAGAAGVKATRFEVTITDGVETGRVAVGEEVRVAPVNEVIGVGSKPVPVAPPPPPVQAAVPAGNCDPNYAGGCVPVDSDVDCAGGSGNGPSYAQGPVTVVGSDIYGLDSDGDGQGCEG
ncbi:G5 domain-containing protein [Arthrobacter sp. JZ12]|uniref:G5 domain-containing protein n=1 Tax=Arthrobacter sp. JZ12 TaxID=2654190 RepID=UPI002B496A8F|nr:G5 domain-containing protein [Arthrobacter sp. JZ12]